MDFERQGDNHSDAEPARGCLTRAGIKPERGSVEKLPRKSKGAVSKRVIPLTGDRGFESLYLHREESSAHPVLPAVAVPRSGGPANEGSERRGFSRSGPFRRTLRRHILSSIDGIGAEEPLVGDRAIAIVDYDFRRFVGFGQPNRFRDRILAAGKVGS